MTFSNFLMRKKWEVLFLSKIFLTVVSSSTTDPIKSSSITLCLKASRHRCFEFDTKWCVNSSYRICSNCCFEFDTMRHVKLFISKMFQMLMYSLLFRIRNSMMFHLFISKMCQAYSELDTEWSGNCWYEWRSIICFRFNATWWTNFCYQRFSGYCFG